MISFRSTPFKIDFAGNRPCFDIRVQPDSQSPRNTMVVFAIYQIPYVQDVAGDLELATPYGTITRRIMPSGTASSYPQHIQSTTDPATMVERTLSRLCNEAFLAEHYRVEAWKGIGNNNLPCCFLRLTSREAKTETRPSLSYLQDGASNNGVNGRPVIHFWEGTDGREAVSKENYRIVGRFVVNRQIDRRGNYLDSGTDDENIETAEFSIWHTGDRALIDTRMLKSYFNRMDLPEYREPFGAYPLRHLMLRYRLRAGDIYNGQDTAYLTTSNELVLLNARVRTHKFPSNEPDWGVPDDFSGQISQYTRLLNYSTPCKATVRSYIDCPQYVYVANFTDSGRTLRVSLSCVNGENASVGNQLTIPPMSVCRIPVSASQLIGDDSLTSAVSYRVVLADGHRIVLDRTFELVKKPHFAREFLLQSHLGVAESFYADHLTIDKETEGDEIVINHETDVALSHKGDIVTMHTGFKSTYEMELMAAAVENENNYLLSGDIAFRINFLPDTLTVIDEGEDLQSAEVQFSIGAPICLSLKKESGDHVPSGDTAINGNMLLLTSL